MNLTEIATQIREARERIILIYAFNATGKTRLSVEYKGITRNAEGAQTGIYYNAFSEDLFVWDNDHDNSEQDIKLEIVESSLNRFHSSLTEDAIREKLIPYKPRYDFYFDEPKDKNPENGIPSVCFYRKGDDKTKIKISRGEERIFVWCFFLALFEVEGWAEPTHFFIDDPVSSLDDHNIFITADTIFRLIENNLDKRDIIVTSHHLGLISILSDWISKGEKAEMFVNRDKSKKYKTLILEREEDDLILSNPRRSVLLYHLCLLQLLEEARKKKEIYTHHFALLRQALENIASFLGVGQFGYVLEQIGITPETRVADIVNALSHQKVYYYQTDTPVPENKAMFEEVMERLMKKYNFKLHTE
ncbi:MAG: anticodon nuclease [Bacteroidetes bacterium 43-93]|nr:AAA family ATPase [Bacteroidota bacterium]OJW97746.1 MAG: anticodon nuclease [Bacteroidetes bacterium 43-93]